MPNDIRSTERRLLATSAVINVVAALRWIISKDNTDLI